MLLIILTWLFIGLCVYVYAGYPLLLAALAKLRSNPPKKCDWTPPVSLIIAAYNEADVLAEKLKNSLQLNYPRDMLQIIVAADGSDDETPVIARKFEDVTVLHSPERRGKSAALNRAVEVASGDILVFSDANAFYDADVIREIVRNFGDPAVGCVSGRKTVTDAAAGVGTSEGLYWRYESFLKQKESVLHSTTGVVGEINAVRRDQYRPIPPQIINDDAYLAMNAMRQGHRVIYEAAAYSWETPVMTHRDEAIRRQRINAGRYQLLFAPQLWIGSPPLVVWMLVSHKFARLLLPFFMLGALVFNTAALGVSDTPRLLWFTWVVQLLFYALALVGWVAENRGIAFKPARIAYYLVSTNVAGISGLLRFLRGKQTVLWEKAARVQQSP